MDRRVWISQCSQRFARAARQVALEIREKKCPFGGLGHAPLSVFGSAGSTRLPHRGSTSPPDEDQHEWMLVSSERRPDEAHARRLQAFDTLSGASVFDAVNAW